VGTFAVEASYGGEPSFLAYNDGEVWGWPVAAVIDAEIALRALADAPLGATPTGPWYGADDDRGCLLAILSVLEAPFELEGAPELPEQPPELDEDELQEAYVETLHPRDRLGRWRDKLSLVRPSRRFRPPRSDVVSELQDEWIKLDRALQAYAGQPEHPEARRIIDEQKEIVHTIHHLNVGATERGLGAVRDVVIVGAGPAGMSAAIYGGTEGLNTLLIDSNVTAGGQIALSSRVVNTIGFPAGVTGRQFAENAIEQAQRVGAETRFATTVTSMDYDPETRIKRLHLSDNSYVDAHAVVIAGGVQFRSLDVPGGGTPDVVYGDAEKLKERCRGRRAVIVGGANSAAQAALHLAEDVPVSIVIRSHLRERMSAYLADQIEAHDNIDVLEGATVAEVHVGPDGRMDSVKLSDGRVIPCGAAGMFIGSSPNASWAQVPVDDDGYVIVGEGTAGHLETNVPGVFAAGDIRAGSTHRVIAAAADGAVAISQVHGFLAQQKQAPVGVREAPARDAADEWMDAAYEFDLGAPFTGFDRHEGEPLREAFDPSKHPRDRLGRWARKAGHVPIPGMHAAAKSFVVRDWAIFPEGFTKIPPEAMPDELHRDALERTVEAIDSVHGIHSKFLPRTVPYVVAPIMPPGSTGFFATFASENETDHTPTMIATRPGVPPRHLAPILVHEFAHYLDSQVLARMHGAWDRGHSYLTDDWDAAEGPHILDGLMEAFRSTRKWRLLDGYRRGIGPGPQMTFDGATGEMTELDPTSPEWQGYLNYLLSPVELFARGYMQYIALRMPKDDTHGELRDNLNVFAADGMVFPQQWNDEDFLPVAAAYDDLFEKLGWRGEQ
jgi:thioredoxin reductase